MARLSFGGRRRRGGRFPGALAGFAAGAGLVFLLDPRRGGARRSQMLQRAGRVLREVEGTVEAGARDLEHRARGIAHEVAVRVERDQASDEVVVERVRARLGRLTAHARAIRVTSRGGHLELSGPVFSAEHAQVLRGARLVRGVRSVEDRLEPHESAEGVPALQGAGPRAGPRPDPLQRSWAPRTKLLAGAAGTLLVGRALFGTGPARIPAGIAGAALLGKVLGDSEPASREVRRAARAASIAVNRERERGAQREGHEGAWHPEAEVGPGRPARAPGRTWSAAGEEEAPGDGGTRSAPDGGASGEEPE